ncbi:MAG: hypothetical protein ACHQU0_03270 [Candidatus Paceibacteria bacterium]
MDEQKKFEQPLKMFIVSILCKRGGYDLFMKTGINEDRRGRFTTTPDRSQARPFAKLTAESLAELLSSPKYGLRARVEPQTEEPCCDGVGFHNSNCAEIR